MFFRTLCNPPFRACRQRGDCLTKIMRLTGILLLAGFLQVSARGDAQTVTYSGRSVPLTKVFSEVKRQTGYVCFYNNEFLNGTRLVTVRFDNAPLRTVMETVLAGERLQYEIQGNTIVITRPVGAVVQTGDTSLLPPAGKTDVHGVVYTEGGQPLAGANVAVRGTGKGTITDGKGEFFLKAVEPNAVLIITSIGVEKVERRLGGKTNLVINTKLAVNSLDETVVIAYGTTTQRFSTGNVTSVKAKDIEKQPVNNPLLALQGRVPGLFITQSTGYAGTGVTVRIQGQNSIRNGNDPLYVIDGVPYNSQLLPVINTIKGESGTPADLNGHGLSGSPLNFINPADIESIDVLKDADATAIYGSRAANGAILITTKKAKAGKLDVNFNVQTGYGQTGRKIKVLNTAQYLEMRREANKNDGTTPDPNIDYDLFNNYGWNSNRNTDWQKVLMGNRAKYTDVQGSFSGGSDNFQFMLGGGFHRETTVLPVNFADQKASFHFSANAKSPDQKLTLAFSGNFMTDDNHLPGFDLTPIALTTPPNAPELYNKDGSLNDALDANGSTTWTFVGNPVAPLISKGTTRTNNVTADLTLGYRLLPGLNLKSSFGYHLLQSKEVLAVPIASITQMFRQYSTRTSVFGDNSTGFWSIEPQITFNKTIGAAKIDLLAGATIQESGAHTVNVRATGYISDDNMETMAGASAITLDYDVKSEYHYNAVFGRANLNWNNKYIINATARQDGSSRFGSNNLFHTFGSIAGAWIFSEEGLLKDKLPVLSFGKVKASYGTTGSDQIGDYRYVSLYGPVIASMPYQGVSGILPTALPNAYLQWEETKKFQTGLDLGFFHDRILINATYFRNLSSNQLLEYSLPYTTGFGGVTSNFPATVQNTGWELSLNTVNVKNGSFQWSTAFNVTISRNKLVKFNNLEETIFSGNYIVGRSLNILRIFDFAGVDPQTGEYQFRAADGHLTSTPNDPKDKTVIQNLFPDFYGGFQNSITYKNLSLDLSFQFVKQNGKNYRFGRQPGYFSGTTGNQPEFVLNRWRNVGDHAAVQRYNANLSLAEQYSDADYSNAAYSDASFIRLKNVSLALQLPRAWQEKIRAKQLQIFVNAQNLLTITHYQGLDPETVSSANMPPLKVITAGIKATF
jgi:TonB-linked SusC/RagA family outer membrane protein